jgi:hypothetical protein
MSTTAAKGRAPLRVFAGPTIGAVQSCGDRRGIQAFMRTVGHDPDQYRRRNCRQRWRMVRRLTNIEVVAIAIIVLSVATIAFVTFSIWAEP